MGATRKTAMNASAGTGVFLLSMLSIPISYIFNFLVYTNSTEALVVAGAFILLVIATSARILLRKKLPKDPLFYGGPLHQHSTWTYDFLLGWLCTLSHVPADGCSDHLGGKLQNYWPLLGRILPNVGNSLHSRQSYRKVWDPTEPSVICTLSVRLDLSVGMFPCLQPATHTGDAVHEYTGCPQAESDAKTLGFVLCHLPHPCECFLHLQRFGCTGLSDSVVSRVRAALRALPERPLGLSQNPDVGEHVLLRAVLHDNALWTGRPRL
ncbi:hypothetical protein SKAU_G00350210 [Synaphobranchus kaupii]|uniref:Transmembrane 6 superfamily member 1/2 transmembrane domain-containing protein n=1 Tax=Synaphobranchus kaupii TaxID=118154 RepID=A0A9Q1EKD0_SYNKA|nr:hypothetical protein SKAU_G00350210 [Synaphobranchus kaupii]